VAREELKSEALRINLETTRVAVHIDPKYEAMRTVVLDYVGLLQQTENLLAELNHPYRNCGDMDCRTFPFTLPTVRVLRCADW
jgi:hypothetical protein